MYLEGAVLTALKILAAERGCRVNDLVAEAVEALLVKAGKMDPA